MRALGSSDAILFMMGKKGEELWKLAVSGTLPTQLVLDTKEPLTRTSWSPVKTRFDFHIAGAPAWRQGSSGKCSRLLLLCAGWEEKSEGIGAAASVPALAGRGNVTE